MTDAPRYSAETLGRVLEAQGRKAIWLAEQVGVSRSLISLVITGRRTIAEPTARQIALILGVPFEQVFEPVTAPEPVEAAA